MRAGAGAANNNLTQPRPEPTFATSSKPLEDVVATIAELNAIRNEDIARLLRQADRVPKWLQTSIAQVCIVLVWVILAPSLVFGAVHSEGLFAFLIIYLMYSTGLFIYSVVVMHFFPVVLFPPRRVLHSFLRGQLTGTFMISYSWSMEDVDVARQVGAAIPCSWIDVRRLIPGSNVPLSCRTAAENAKVAYVFVSRPYLESKNCQLEFSVLRKTCKGRLVAFIGEDCYQADDVKALADELLKDGNFVFPISQVKDNDAAAFVLAHLISSGLLQNLFQQVSPAINDGWKGTAARLYGLAPTTMYTWSCIYAIWYLITFGLLCSLNTAKFDSGAHVFPATAAAIVFSVLFYLLGMVCLFLITVHIRSNFAFSTTVPEVGALLAVLVKLRIIGQNGPIRLALDQDLAATPCYQTLRKLGVLHVVPCSDPNADFYVVNLDGDGQLTPDFKVSSMNTLYYTCRPSFTALLESLPPAAEYDKLRQELGKSLVHCGSHPSTEAVLCQLLSRLLNCPTSRFCIGQISFRHLPLKVNEFKETFLRAVTPVN